MSTIKINELATTDIALTDFIAKADVNGLMTKNTVSNLSAFFETVGEVGFKGSVLIADNPTQDGWYLAGEAGTFPNIGGLVALGQSVTIFVISDSDTTYSKIDIPITLPLDNLPTFGSLNSVTSGGVKLELLTKANTEIGKNKYNYNDSSNLTQSYFSNSSGNIATGNANTMITHYIKVSNGDILYSDNMFGSSAFHELTDIFAQNPTYIAAVSGKTFTATQDGFVRLSLNISLANSTTTQIELGTSQTAIVPFSTTILDSEIPLNIPRFSEGTTINDYSKLVEGKNIFNYNDSSNITPGYFKNTSGGIGTGNANLLITHYIPVSNGQKIYSNNLLDSSNTYHELTDTSKLNPTYISATGLKVFTATQDGFVRLSLNKGSIIQFSDIMVEYGIQATQFQPYLKEVNKLLLPQPVFDHRLVNTITCKRYGTSGVDADFCGLNAVGDALNSITDASATNRYKIKVEGVFLFTLQTEFAYNEPRADQPTIIIGKNWVDIEGLGKQKTVIAVELDPSQTFTGGKTYFDFQPVAWNCNSNLSNMAIIGKNCRYSIHIESADLANDAIMNFNHLYIDFKGSTAMGGSGGNAIGTGMRKGQVWNFNNCYIRSAGNPFGLHTALEVLEKGGEVNLKNCNLIGDNLSFEMFPNNQIINFTLENCDFSKSLQIKYRYSYDDGSVLADYSDIKINSTSKALLVDNSNADKGQGLRIKSKSTGVNSTVSFDETSTAFDVIIGDSTKLVEVSNNQLNKSQYGYQWKDGGVGLSGYAIGSIDIDENNTSKTNGLGVLLGDCSTLSKTLTVVIDSVSYNIVFNENFTLQNNAYVIGKITDIIGTVAYVDAFYVGQEYFPKFSETQEMENGDTTAILSGMGVVFISSTEMRIAINSDNRIDGICLYDTAVGEKGIVIEKGNIWAMNKGFRFSTLETSNTGRNKGDELGISPTQDGYFELSASPSLLRAFEFNALEIL